MRLPRASGVLLHPTSLPGRYGIGDMGPEAHAFVDFLAETGQAWWQILPLGPTGYGNSPYQSPSSFAGNPLLISPDRLVEQGWLDAREVEEVPPFPEDQVDFDAVSELKLRLLRRAFKHFRSEGTDGGFERFRDENRAWLADYVLFQALRDAQVGRPWYDWEKDLVVREPAAMARARLRLAEGIAFHEFVQFAFESQWQELRSACRDKGVSLIGDVPIFVAHDSADVWAHPELFSLDERGRPLVVAGVPPDYFSETGQLWGNPLYRWEAHSQQGYQWWLSRLLAVLGRVDIVRMDHFRGFAAYWEIPAGSETAATGRWVPAPGREFLQTIRREWGSIPFIAEDLGVITPDVEALRDEFDLPGMRVLQFGFDADPAAEKHLPHRFVPNCVAYTGTHDNDTTYGWFHAREAQTTQPRVEVEAGRTYARRYTHGTGEEIHWDLIRMAFASVAATAIIPMQDLLGLESTARMNFPGKAEGNWRWRFRKDQVDRRIRDRLADVTSVYSRWNGTIPPALDPHLQRSPQEREPSPAIASTESESPKANRGYTT